LPVETDSPPVSPNAVGPAAVPETSPGAVGPAAVAPDTEGLIAETANGAVTERAQRVIAESAAWVIAESPYRSIWERTIEEFGRRLGFLRRIVSNSSGEPVGALLDIICRNLTRLFLICLCRCRRPRRAGHDHRAGRLDQLLKKLPSVEVAHGGPAFSKMGGVACLCICAPGTAVKPRPRINLRSSGLSPRPCVHRITLSNLFPTAEGGLPWRVTCVGLGRSASCPSSSLRRGLARKRSPILITNSGQIPNRVPWRCTLRKRSSAARKG